MGDTRKKVDGICLVCSKPEVEDPYSKARGWSPPLMCCAFGQKREEKK